MKTQVEEMEEEHKQSAIELQMLRADILLKENELLVVTRTEAMLKIELKSAQELFDRNRKDHNNRARAMRSAHIRARNSAITRKVTVLTVQQYWDFSFEPEGYDQYPAAPESWNAYLVNSATGHAAAMLIDMAMLLMSEYQEADLVLMVGVEDLVADTFKLVDACMNSD